MVCLMITVGVHKHRYCGNHTGEVETVDSGFSEVELKIDPATMSAGFFMNILIKHKSGTMKINFPKI